MVIYSSVLLLTAVGAGFGFALRPALRRALATTTAPQVSEPEAAAAAVPLTLELPAELQHLPEPPLLEAAAVEILEPLEITRRLRQLELGLEDLGPPLSVLLRYAINFCLLWTIILSRRLLLLSLFSRRLFARTLIFAVKIAICTSEDPVSAPILLWEAVASASGFSFLMFCLLLSPGVRTPSVLCRPNSSIHL